MIILWLGGAQKFVESGKSFNFAETRVFLMKKIGIHLGIMLVIAFGLILVFFYNFLPSYTNHGETITVPDLRGMAFSELEDFLSDNAIPLKSGTVI